MIYQISAIPAKALFFSLKKRSVAPALTTPVQKAVSAESDSVDHVAWSPMTAGPYLVPVSRWIE